MNAETLLTMDLTPRGRVVHDLLGFTPMERASYCGTYGSYIEPEYREASKKAYYEIEAAAAKLTKAECVEVLKRVGKEAYPEEKRDTLRGLVQIYYYDALFPVHYTNPKV